MAKGSLSREQLHAALQHVPQVTADDIDEALCRARLKVAVDDLCKRRNDVHNEAEAREAFTLHIDQCFHKYFFDALHRMHAGQIPPSVFVRHLRRLGGSRSGKSADEIDEITALVLARERGRVPIKNRTRSELAKSAAAYERQKVAAGRGGNRHERDEELWSLYGGLMDGYCEFTGLKPGQAHINSDDEYDGKFIRFALYLFQAMAAKARACAEDRVAQVGETLGKQTRSIIRDCLVSGRRHHP